VLICEPMKKEEIKNKIKISMETSLTRIEKLSSEALATGLSTGLMMLSGKGDKSNEEVQKLFSHFATIHSYDQLGQEVKLLIEDAKSSAPDLGKVIKEISGTRSQLMKRVMDRVTQPSPEKPQ